MILFKLFLLLLKKIRSLLKHSIKHAYWIYNLSRIKNILHVSLNFPIVIEGKGQIEIGTKSVIQEQVKLAVSKTGKLYIGDNSIIGPSSEIKIGINSTLSTGNEFLLENFSRIYANNTWHFGHGVKIATYCAIFSREQGYYGKLLIGDGTHIGDHTIIDVCEDINIGKEVAIGPNCVIYTHDHDYSNKEKPAWKGGIIAKSVVIEDGAWIGSGVTILPNVKIGARAVIAAGSVVTKSIPPESIVGGIPAKSLKK
jgi:acetyltransferase-like isoleucine patch superfamily enzyme